MNTKKCEHCGEEIHINTKKCPFCGELVEIPEIIEEEPIEEIKNEEEQKGLFIDNTVGEELKKAPDKEELAFIYKVSEPTYSKEQIKPLPNLIKVFLTAFCMIPFIGQVIGIFFGIFFLTYDDKDRTSYGKSIIILSTIMLCFYLYYAWSIYNIMNNPQLMEQMLELYNK